MVDECQPLAVGAGASPKPDSAKKEATAKPMPAFDDCEECNNCGGRGSRNKRCLDVQMKESVHLGHEAGGD
jgi:hypothetical protein